LGISISADHGGIGGSWADECIVLEEQAYAHCHAPAITVHSSIVLPYIANYGTQEQKEK
jgi:alkylation response protein AidB-like acyl-CoA dehydrogenase